MKLRSPSAYGIRIAERCDTEVEREDALLGALLGASTAAAAAVTVPSGTGGRVGGEEDESVR